MKKTTYKISVLLDLKSSNTAALKSTASLAKIINAKIELFHVQKSTELVDMESQLSAKRAINDAYRVTENKLKGLAAELAQTYDIAIEYSFTSGNVKREIKQYLKDTNPDIVVLGKKKKKILKPLGDNFTSFMLQKHKGAILIADFKNSFEPNNELSLGLFNYEQLPTSISFLPELMAHIKKPLKSFKMRNNEKAAEGQQTDTLNTVDFVFDACENVPETLAKYVAINDVNLLCIGRTNKGEKSNTIQANLKDIINSINVPLLFTGSKELHLP
ncbi:universal stress protein [Cellulophaga sp. L1A9]|uniref:universal stress protein n=1 Tax=Cellulophaga sp. L1A9 TaxID=2686362 RepID=UPI00131AF7A8|nr:universal stress protein [Cellulophaga sp. L1A9]